MVSVRSSETPATALLTVAELAELLRVSEKAVYHLVAMRRIPHLKLGRSLRFVREDVDSWLERNRVPSLEQRR